MTNDDDTALRRIADALLDPSQGLPDPVFHFILKVTPMINIDLYVRDAGRTLLAWREDAYGVGWHIPGGIIRHNEPIATRIAKTARGELGADVEAAPHPLSIKQFFHARGHFISLLYRCTLVGDFAGSTRFHEGGAPVQGDLAWFTGAPPDLYPAHEVYRDLLAGT